MWQCKILLVADADFTTAELICPIGDGQHLLRADIPGWHAWGFGRQNHIGITVALVGADVTLYPTAELRMFETQLVEIKVWIIYGRQRWGLKETLHLRYRSIGERLALLNNLLPFLVNALGEGFCTQCAQ